METLSERLYKELNKYRYHSLPKDGKNQLQAFLAEKEYIVPDKTELTELFENEYVIDTLSYKISTKGKNELELQDKMREQEAKHISEQNFRYVYDALLVFGGFLLGLLTSYIVHKAGW